jgi:hypothetical protein
MDFLFFLPHHLLIQVGIRIIIIQHASNKII